MNTSTESPTMTSPELTLLPTAESEHRSNGKIARLPKVLRDQVNQMLDDGVPYKAIIEKLEQSVDPPLPYKLLEMNISRWKDNGYQRYLRHQEWRDDLRIIRDSGSEMTEFNDGPKFQETLVQIALTEIFRVLQQRELKSDSLNFIRLFNALARLNREALGLKKYNDLLAREQAELKQLDPNRKISQNEHVAIVDTIDHILEMPRPGRNPSSIQNPEPSNPSASHFSHSPHLASRIHLTRRRTSSSKLPQMRRTPPQPRTPEYLELKLFSQIENRKSKIENNL